MKTTFWIIIILTFIGPLWILLSGQIDFHTGYLDANRESAHLAPDPKTTPEAIIEVYTARAFNWRGIFGVHTWIAVKPKNATQYTVYQVVGWRSFFGKEPLMMEPEIPDRYWFGNRPQTLLDLRGEKAAKLIPDIEAAAKRYPYPTDYTLWPGPNSNTFVAFVARQVPDLGLALSPDAIGKDYLPGVQVFARAPSGTGYQFSLFGILGITIARKEGLEINLLGLVYGINPAELAIDLPALGAIKLKDK